MDRLSRVIAAGTSVLVLGTVLFSAGCRSMRNDIPPGKSPSTTGGGPPFSSDPHPNNNMGLYPPMTPGSPGGVNNGLGGATGTGTLGTPAPNASPYVGPNTSPYNSGGASVSQ
jgi:hypothetical protein